MSSEDFLAEKSISTRNDCAACRVINKVSLSMEIFCYVIATLACIPLLIFMIAGLLDGSGFSQNQFNLLILILICTKSYSAEVWINRLIAGNKHNQNEKNTKTEQVD